MTDDREPTEPSPKAKPAKRTKRAQPAKPAKPAPSAPSLLVVATIAPTIRQFLVPYAIHLRKLGWRVDAAANGAVGEPILQDAFDSLYELPLSRSILDLRGMLRGYRAVSAILDEARPAIVHVHTPIAAFVTRLAVRRIPAARRPMVAYTAHGFHFYKGGSPVTNATFVTAERIAGRWTDRLVVMNDEDESGARRHRIVPPRRLIHMPGIGLDTNYYARSSLASGALDVARREYGVDPGAPLLVAVGELSRRKRMADVISAFALVHDPKARLVIAGEGFERPRLEDLIRKLGLVDRVTLAGKVADVRPLVASARALILASDREGLPRAIMEALSLEVPVIASDARGNGELVGSDSGFIYPIGDVNALAGHMDWLIDHPAEAQAMGVRARARMVEQYDIAALIALHDELYAGLLSERMADPARSAQAIG
jgi:glycosyltransferase involved in cell wall biosynthesis